MKGFKYDKFKEETSGNDSWGSYSDLFMVLSFVFLMMYVVASLRSGTSSIQSRLERQQIARDNADLKSQIKAYNTLKDSALQEESKDEQQVYNELMDKLSLLQEEAKEEKNNLRRQATENEKKELALNKYQQVVRNIINANLLAKNKLKVREEIIENKNQEIGDLSQELVVKKDEIVKNNKEINQINSELSKNIANLEKAQKTSKITKQKAFEQIARLKKQSMAKIEELNNENQQVQSRLAVINKELSKTSEKLAETETTLATTTETLNKTVNEYESQIDVMKNTHTEKMAKERAAFENKIKAAKLTATQKAQQLAEFNKMAREKDQAVGRKIASLQGELSEAEARENAKAQENAALASELTKTSQKLEKTVGDHESQIKGMQAAHDARMAKEKTALENKIKAANMSAQEKAQQLAEFNKQNKEKSAALDRQIAGLKGDLAQAQARADARMKLSKEIAKALKAAGVSADVNPNTGDVTISFNGDYFDNGSSTLKPTMATVLQKFIPKYSESLFKDANIASKITSVDIVGFASPTYQNKYIDPQSLDPMDQKAAKFNLDLSYKRARSIFDYMFDTSKINYKNQKQLLPLVKVTGRSFFTEGRAPAGAIPGMSQKEFCQKFDCKQSQKVIIKFNMDDKK